MMLTRAAFMIEGDAARIGCGVIPTILPGLSPCGLPDDGKVIEDVSKYP